jgi:catechol 2,3-dioxygenase-like lactoylglutathione lyase family enzyme
MVMDFHHVSIKSADIWRSIAFYEQLGLEVSDRFTAGITLGCWLRGQGLCLEILQVPEPKNFADGFGDEHFVGYYHLSFMVQDLQGTLTKILNGVGELKMLLTPRRQLVGDRVYEVAFIADPDGLAIELMQLV